MSLYDLLMVLHERTEDHIIRIDPLGKYEKDFYIFSLAKLKIWLQKKLFIDPPTLSHKNTKLHTPWWFMALWGPVVGWLRSKMEPV